jgi:hypothetical protein
MKGNTCTNHGTILATSYSSSAEPTGEGSSHPLACVEVVVMVAKVQCKLLAGAATSGTRIVLLCSK